MNIEMTKETMGEALTAMASKALQRSQEMTEALKSSGANFLMAAAGTAATVGTAVMASNAIESVAGLVTSGKVSMGVGLLMDAPLLYAKYGGAFVGLVAGSLALATLASTVADGYNKLSSMASTAKLSSVLASEENKDNPDAIMARQILAGKPAGDAKDSAAKAPKDGIEMAPSAENDAANKARFDGAASRFKTLLVGNSEGSSGLKHRMH